jgi:hypothetical protein
MTPVEALNPENKMKIIENLYGDVENTNKKSKFKIGDRVRIYSYKQKFDKGYKPNWTKEIFIIDNIKNTIPITYIIKDLRHEPILGTFYKEELQKTKF